MFARIATTVVILVAANIALDMYATSKFRQKLISR